MLKVLDNNSAKGLVAINCELLLFCYHKLQLTIVFQGSFELYCLSGRYIF
jgi:hypothetical protein